MRLNQTRRQKTFGIALVSGPMLAGMFVNYVLGGSRHWFLAFYAVAIVAYLIDRRITRTAHQQADDLRDVTPSRRPAAPR
ncbi:hypothetical protein [Candidatus Poriferisodalis sp.]|uniref:hypothetical protein n=1 Tax=Candidatus Poriferisodalis sp. TaxID=3101277 RepID=UPI003C6F25FB